MRNLPDRRQQMINETSAWLTWALDNDVQVPRIPRRRIDMGGFDAILNIPGAREVINHWWVRTLDRINHC